jgi:hypothetical protein
MLAPVAIVAVGTVVEELPLWKVDKPTTMPPSVLERVDVEYVDEDAVGRTTTLGTPPVDAILLVSCLALVVVGFTSSADETVVLSVVEAAVGTIDSVEIPPVEPTLVNSTDDTEAVGMTDSEVRPPVEPTR